MIDEFIKILDKDLECTEYKVKPENKQCILFVQSVRRYVNCPYCNTESSKVHSTYQREIQDLPLQNLQVILLLSTRKMFCSNPECKHKTFAERFDFVSIKGKKTERLINRIIDTSMSLSSTEAASLLKGESIAVCKSSICDLLKKNAFDCG